MNAVDQELIIKITHMKLDDVPAALDLFPEPNRSVLLWLLDMMAEVVKKKNVNRMNCQNMGEMCTMRNIDAFKLILNPEQLIVGFTRRSVQSPHSLLLFLSMPFPLVSFVFSHCYVAKSFQRQH